MDVRFCAFTSGFELVPTDVKRWVLKEDVVIRGCTGDRQ